MKCLIHLIKLVASSLSWKLRTRPSQLPWPPSNHSWSLTEEGSLHDATTNADAEERRHKLNVNPSVSGVSIALTCLSTRTTKTSTNPRPVTLRLYYPSHNSLLPRPQIVSSPNMSQLPIFETPATPDNNLLDGNKTSSLLIPLAMSSRSAICHYLTNSSSAQSPAFFQLCPRRMRFPGASLAHSRLNYLPAAHQRGSSLYTLPNVPISLSPTEKPPSPTIDPASTIVTSETDVHSASFTEANTDGFNQESENAHSILANIQDFKSLQKTFSLLLKIICFLPWYILVSATSYYSLATSKLWLCPQLSDSSLPVLGVFIISPIELSVPLRIS
ncbi:hypothetical protein D9758_009621 [Tetrapyrgos nigripes]|uniref:Uncharacterized protein n=1 Tax=Tetrapyrgos nigripes TaxID=182062 RepID=A0A8H5GD91_9AGAR|nr:hypothetical protein D9758_009621 [Tetrapyrgos nigripes]